MAGLFSRLRSQQFAVGQVVDGRLQRLPAAKGGVAGVGKQKGQPRRFHVAVAKDHVSLASHGVAEESSPRCNRGFCRQMKQAPDGAEEMFCAM